MRDRITPEDAIEDQFLIDKEEEVAPEPGVVLDDAVGIHFGPQRQH
jgi:hypothetical protein